MRKHPWMRPLRRRFRRLFLQFGLPWGAALLVGLVAVLYAQWSTDAYNAFIGWIAGRPWLAFVITPAFTVLAVFATRRWFSGSEGSGIPQVIAALHAPRDETLMQRLFGLRVIAGKLGISLLGFLGGLTIGREGPTVHIGAAIMAETRRFYPHRSPQARTPASARWRGRGALGRVQHAAGRHHLRHRGTGARLREPHQRHHDHGSRVLGPDLARPGRQLSLLRPDQRPAELRHRLRAPGRPCRHRLRAAGSGIQRGAAALGTLDAEAAAGVAGATGRCGTRSSSDS